MIRALKEHILGVRINHVRRILRDLMAAYDFAGHQNTDQQRYKRVVIDFNYLAKRGKNYPNLDTGEVEHDLGPQDTYNTPSADDNKVKS